MWKPFTLGYLVWCWGLAFIDALAGQYFWALFQAAFGCLALYWFYRAWIAKKPWPRIW